VEVGTDADGNRFLTDIGVTGAVNQTTLVGFRQLFLALADQLHPSVKSEQEVSIALDLRRAGHAGSLACFGRTQISRMRRRA
jgi:hypothetical protein